MKTHLLDDQFFLAVIPLRLFIPEIAGTRNPYTEPDISREN
jgi:hypothetical protein